MNSHPSSVLAADMCCAACLVVDHQWHWPPSRRARPAAQEKSGLLRNTLSERNKLQRSLNKGIRVDKIDSIKLEKLLIMREISCNEGKREKNVEIFFSNQMLSASYFMRFPTVHKLIIYSSSRLLKSKGQEHLSCDMICNLLLIWRTWNGVTHLVLHAREKVVWILRDFRD